MKKGLLFFCSPPLLITHSSSLIIHYLFIISFYCFLFLISYILFLLLILSRGGSYRVDIYDTCQLLLKEGSLGGTTLLNIYPRRHHHHYPPQHLPSSSSSSLPSSTSTLLNIYPLVIIIITTLLNISSRHHHRHRCHHFNGISQGPSSKVLE